MGAFDGKIVVVTGAAGGIGTAISTRFASEGGTVISVDYNGEWLEILVKVMGEKGLKTEPLKLDCSDYEGVSKAAADIIMLDANGRELLKILGKEFPEQQAKGILTVAEMPQAIQSIEAALEAEARQLAQMVSEGDAPPPPSRGVSLRQRLLPFLGMVRLCQKAGQPIVWGV